MPHTLLNVVCHQGGRLRFGVINEEYRLEPRPARIRITNLPDRQCDVIVNLQGAYYSSGSIYSEEVNDWLVNHYPRTADDPIWLLKFDFRQEGNEHIYSFVGDSGYRKIPRRHILLTPQGSQEPAPHNADMSAYIWQR